MQWLIFEHLKTPQEAEPGDDRDAFVTHTLQVKSQGTWFNRKRFVSGQIKKIYAIQLKLDGRQVYASKDANKVGLFVLALLYFCWLSAAPFPSCR